MGEAGVLGISWFIWALLALAIAAIFAFLIVPNAEQMALVSGWQAFVVRWGHSLVWVFLAISFALRGIGQANLTALANPIGMLAGITYVLYLFISLRKP